MPSSIHGINRCQCIFIFLKDFCGLSWNTSCMIKENPSPDAYTFLVLTLPPSTSAEPSERPHRDTISAAISAGAKGYQCSCRCWVTIMCPCQGKELRLISSMLLQEFISRLTSCPFFHPSKGQLIQFEETDCSSPHCLRRFTDFWLPSYSPKRNLRTTWVPPLQPAPHMGHTHGNNLSSLHLGNKSRIAWRISTEKTSLWYRTSRQDF